MPEEGHNWTPSAEELAYWRFLRLAGRQLAAHLCLKEHTVTMWARPRDPLMRQAFWTKHAGHEHVFVGEVLDKSLRTQSGQ